MSYLVSLIRRHPLISFFVLAYALSWWPIAFYAAGLSPSTIISFGPFLAALVVLAATQGKTGVVGLLRRIVRWRVGLRWYAVALLLPVVVTAAAAALNVLLLGAKASSSVAELERYAMVLDRCSFVAPTSACRTLRIVQRHA
jgi:hypothetical protein